jgi:tetratricopeptide (TPR) repeat protein
MSVGKMGMLAAGLIVTVLAAWLLYPRASLWLQERGLPLPPPALQGLEPGVRAHLQQAYEAARKLSGDKPGTAGHFGMVLHTYEQYAAAIMAYQRAERLGKDPVRWQYLRALSLIGAGRQKEAVPLLEGLLKSQPQSVYIRIHLAEALLFLKQQPERARDLLREAIINFKSQEPRAFYALGQAQRALKNPERAVARLREAVQAAPYYGLAHQSLAEVFRELKQDDAAEEHAALAERYEDEEPVLADPFLGELRALNRSVESLTRRAVRWSRRGQLKEAVALLQGALASDPSEIKFHTTLMTVHRQTGDAEAVQRHYDAALRLEPKSADARSERALWLRGQRQFEAALSEVEKALEHHPDDVRARMIKARLLAEDLRRGADALVVLRGVLASDATHGAANLLSALLLIRDGQLEAAAPYIGPALADSIGMKRINALLDIAAAYASQRRNDLASPLLAQAVAQALAMGRRRLAASIEDRRLAADAVASTPLVAAPSPAAVKPAPAPKPSSSVKPATPPVSKPR